MFLKYKTNQILLELLLYFDVIFTRYKNNRQITHIKLKIYFTIRQRIMPFNVSNFNLHKQKIALRLSQARAPPLIFLN